MTSLYLVRHGETDWNAQRRIQGRTDIPLNETGRAQARTTGQLLARRSWDGIYSSPLSRARETAEIIGKAIGIGSVGIIDQIGERNYGSAEGLEDAQIEALFPGDTPVPGRETHGEVAARVLPALLDLGSSHPGEALLVVSHGGVIRSVLNAVDPGVWHGRISNGSVHSFQLIDGSLELVAFDDPLDEESLACATEDLDEQNAMEARGR